MYYISAHAQPAMEECAELGWGVARVKGNRTTQKTGCSEVDRCSAVWHPHTIPSFEQFCYSLRNSTLQDPKAKVKAKSWHNLIMSVRFASCVYQAESIRHIRMLLTVSQRRPTLTCERPVPTTTMKPTDTVNLKWENFYWSQWFHFSTQKSEGPRYTLAVSLQEPTLLAQCSA